MNPRLKVDFEVGDVCIEFSGKVVSLKEIDISDAERLKIPNSRLKNGGHGLTFRIDSASFENLIVKVSVYLSSSDRVVFLGPPEKAEWEVYDKFASKLASELQKLSEKEFWRRYQFAEYSWGTIQILAEWRDGGWGAKFVFKGGKNA